MSVTAAAGFVAAGVACGVKPAGSLDLALVATDDARPTSAAGVFTSNRAAAAPVTVSRTHLSSSKGTAAAVVLNSGNANAATGASGQAHAERMCALTADQLGCKTNHVLVCSTGLIGIPLPIDAVTGGLPALVSSRAGGLEAANLAAEAILTTDTVRKETVIEAGGFVVGGMAKGAAMLAPNMATMLAVLTTDAVAKPDVLQKALAQAVSESFNNLTVDGCMSTNDTVIALASGRSGKTVPGPRLADALVLACAGLAAQMAADAEGATKIVRVNVEGARSDEDALRAARRVAESQLVKCSLYGADPYWGRVVSELGSAGVAFDPRLVSVSYGGVVVCRNGEAAEHDAAAVKTYVSSRHLELTADLGLGRGAATILTTDLSPAYIAENMGTS